jgi:hypothetical protein
MTASPKAYAIIKRFEGLRLQSYRDIVGVWTVGYGCTNGAHPDQVHHRGGSGRATAKRGRAAGANSRHRDPCPGDAAAVRCADFVRVQLGRGCAAEVNATEEAQCGRYGRRGARIRAMEPGGRECAGWLDSTAGGGETVISGGCMTLNIQLIIAIGGLLIYAIATNGKLSEIGRVMFAMGLLAWLLK